MAKAKEDKLGYTDILAKVSALTRKSSFITDIDEQIRTEKEIGLVEGKQTLTQGHKNTNRCKKGCCRSRDQQTHISKQALVTCRQTHKSQRQLQQE